MKLILSVTEGPHKGREFAFDGHDTFLVGRVDDAHLQLSYDDPYFSRRHFMLEINPPRCQLLDLRSRNGVYLNGQKVESAEVRDGDIIKAGHTHFLLRLAHIEVGKPLTLDIHRTLPAPSPEVTAPPSPAVTTSPASMPTSVDALGNSIIQGYEIVRELGRGGMGVVHEVIRLSDRKRIALKMIIPNAGVSEKQIDRFIREAKILEKLRHPNIVGFERVGLEGEWIFLAMELVTGPDAEKMLLESGPLAIRTAVRMVCQMLAGLQHAHDLGFVHRDIKPSNMLIHAEGGKKQTKLADFGLARAYETSQLSGLTMQGELGGTPAFMPPEQITHFRDVKPAADQYSAAASLYNLLTGKYIYDFPRGRAHEALLMISTEDPVAIRSRRADIPEGLAVAIHKALSREAKSRFGRVEEFRQTLKQWA